MPSFSNVPRPSLWTKIPAAEEEEEDDIDLDLSAGALDKSNDPVRLYLREMGIVPLLTREGEVTIAKRIERGQIKTRKSISRSPISVERLDKDRRRSWEAAKASIRETVAFSEQAEISLEEDKAEEYLRWTLEGIGNIKQNFAGALKVWIALRNEQKAQLKLAKGKKSKKLLRLKRQTARLRLEIAQEIKNLNLTEHSMQVMIASIRKVVVEDIQKAERNIKKAEERLAKKPGAAEKRELNAKIAEAKQSLVEVEEKFHLSPIEIKALLSDNQRRRI